MFLPLLKHSALALFAQRPRIPTSTHSIGFYIMGSTLIRVRARVRAVSHKRITHNICFRTGCRTDSATPPPKKKEN
jgi:hypothetical protein